MFRVTCCSKSFALSAFVCALPIIVIVVLATNNMTESSQSSKDKQIHKLALANNDFSLRLAKAVLEESEGKTHRQQQPAADNVFLSPFSVSLALTMLMAGSATTTYDSLFQVLGLARSGAPKSNKVFEIYHDLLDDLSAATNQSKGSLDIANGLAIQNNVQLAQEFMHILSDHFHSEVMLKDFQHNSGQAVLDINEWVSNKTHKKIPALVQTLPASTVLVLLNAIYFKASWSKTFSKSRTKEEPFYLPGNGGGQPQHQVQMMHITRLMSYGHFEDGDLLEIEYKNGIFSMFIFLPHKIVSKFTDLPKLFDSNQWETRLENMDRARVTLSMPRFRVESAFQLNDVLSQLGLANLFDNQVDLSKIGSSSNMKVSSVIHKTYIHVDEEGSEAAAATAIIGLGASFNPNPPKEVDFTVNRPFMFLIRQNWQKLTIFSGFVRKP